jgi:hypothetical protein
MYPSTVEGQSFLPMNFPPYMFGPAQGPMPAFTGQPNYSTNSGTQSFQPSMDQLAQMYYYQMWMQQYANQFYNQPFPQNQFKK